MTGAPATRGRVPGRSDSHVGHNHGPKDQITPDKSAAGDVVIRWPANERWHPVAIRLYDSLLESGMSRYFESSDWASAYLICDQVSRKMGKVYIGMQVVGPAGRQEALYDYLPMSGGDLNAIMTALGKLGVTEGDRRRLRIELQRGEPDDGPTEGQTAVEEAQAALGIPRIEGGQRVG